jgi:hypothetical protein
MSAARRDAPLAPITPTTLPPNHVPVQILDWKLQSTTICSRDKLRSEREALTDMKGK